MTTFLALTTLGLVVGCIYALTATGLVVTYNTSGIFNFAHGAIGMVAAFSYWQLTVAWGWPAPLALVLILLVAAPLFGAAVERVLIRPLAGAAVDLSIVITLGLLLFLLGLANMAWKPRISRVLPEFFDSADPVEIGALKVSINQLLIVAVAISVAIALRVFFQRTRVGIAMRGVVDDPDLAAMAGVSPARIQQLSWALGATLASLAGIMLAPLVTLNILTLTLLVINGYAAALFGRLKSLPRTAVGAIILGLAINYGIGYSSKLPFSSFLTEIQPALPMIFLFGILIFSPPARLRTATLAATYVPTVPGPRESFVLGSAFLVLAVVLSQSLSSANLIIGSRALALAITLLSLVLLTGYAGLTSLCHLTFVGLGAYAMGTWGGGSLWGVLAAVLLSAAAGAAVALPTLRLRGLYLALATFAFAAAMDTVFFNNRLGEGGSLDVPRLDLPLVPTESNQAFFMLCAVCFVLASLGVLAVRRGRWGRQLTALNDSPAACATLGVNVNVTKLVVFAASAGLAGLSGALFGGLRGQVSPNDFAALGSLVLLLTLRIGGVSTVTGALFGAVTVALFPTLQDHVPQVPQLAFLLTGLAAISVGRDPDGVGGQVSRLGEKLRARAAARGYGDAGEAPETFEEQVLVHH
jgi:branched-chain amino acid transport system permease protein